MAGEGTVHKGPGHPVIYPREEIFPVAPCTFAGRTHSCPRQPKSYLLRSYDSIEVPVSQLRARPDSELSPWYRAKAKEFGTGRHPSNPHHANILFLAPHFSWWSFDFTQTGYWRAVALQQRR